MSIILKYCVPVDDRPHNIDMREGATIVHAACQHTPDSVELWALTPDREAAYVTRTFAVFGTGHPIPDGWDHHRGTALALDGSLVWHVMERA